MSRPVGRPKNATTALVPAGARMSETLTSSEALLNFEGIETFAKAIGGRDALVEVLSVAGTSPEIERITTLLLDPRYHGWGLPRLCQMVGITVADLFASYRKALFARAHIQASHIIAARLPPVVEDVMARAVPQRMVCPACQGTSAVGQGPCLPCQSLGYVQSEPDLDRQKLALELGQLLEKKGGLIVQQNNLAATVGATGTGSLEQLQQAVGDLLFGGGRKSDAIDVPAGDVTLIDPIGGVLRDDEPDPDEEPEEPNEPDDTQPDLPDELPFPQPDSPPSAPRPQPDATGQP